MEVNLRLQSEIKCEKMSSATPRRHLSKDDKLAIIEASKSPGFSKEEAMKKWGIRRTQMYDLLKNKKVLETKLIESPVRSAKRVSGLPQKQIELEDRLFRWIGLNERRGLLLDGVKICKQAQNLANELNFSSGLQFTEGWLRVYVTVIEFKSK